MENQKNILTKADIRIDKKRIRWLNYYIIMAFTLYVLGFFVADGGYFECIEWRDHYDYWGNYFPLSEFHWSISWYGVTLLPISELSEYGMLFASQLVFISFIVLFICPLLFRLNANRLSKITSLTITDSSVSGSYSSFIVKKTLNMPLEKINNISITNSILDKVRSGRTLALRTSSGVIRLHLVHNAEEVVEITMRRIEELSNAKKTEQPSEYIQAGTTVSTSDKVKELLLMKESGLITEEEFLKKKEDLLSKM